MKFNLLIVNRNSHIVSVKPALLNAIYIFLTLLRAMLIQQGFSVRLMHLSVVQVSLWSTFSNKNNINGTAMLSSPLC